ncbi:MAG: permease prefix domain 1-containing protein [Lysinibacillus sp.]
MKRIEQFVDVIVADLPVNEHEKNEMKEEMMQHLFEHFDELMLQGYTKEQAISTVVASFGSEKTIGKEMKKVLFQYYKFVRFFVSAIAVAALFCVTSHLLTVFYFPQHDSAITVDLFLLMVMICIIFLGVAELAYEGVTQIYHNNKWINPWSFYLIPALLLTGIVIIEHISNLEQGNHWIYNDLLGLPLYPLFYVVSRQLFTLLFVRRKRQAAHKTTLI